MEIRYRASVSRTSKGYSCDATVEMTGPSWPDAGDALRDETLARIKEFMGLLEASFPKEVEA